MLQIVLHAHFTNLIQKEFEIQKKLAEARKLVYAADEEAHEDAEYW